MQRLFLSPISDRSASEAAWEEIESAKEPILEEVGLADAGSLDLESLSQQVRSKAGFQPWRLMIIDRHWKFVRDDTPATVSTETAKNLSWQPLRTDSAVINSPLRGILRINGRPHVAAAFPLSLDSGFLMIHVPTDSIRLSAAQFRESMPLSIILAGLWTCTSLGICTYLIYSRLSDHFIAAKLDTDTESLKKAQSLVRTQDAVIFGLANLAESRDPETGMHLERISLYAKTLAQALRRHAKFRDVVDEEFVRLIGTSSALHDIGKVGIEDAILRKPGRLSEEERKEIQRHPVIGSDCLLKIERRLGSSNFLHMAREIARSHHEWWDGSGYPDGRIGREIPLAARIVSVADVYDALATRRVYKPDLPHVACVGFIKRGSGTQFDPDLVAAFLEVEQQFRRIAEQHSDTTYPKRGAANTSPAVREHVDVELIDSNLRAADLSVESNS